MPGLGCPAAGRTHALVVVCCSLLLHSLLPVQAQDKQQPPWKDRKYLLPVLRAGPNNQLRHLRFMLALAKQLNRTLILTGITKHYTDRGTRFKLPKPKNKQQPEQQQQQQQQQTPVDSHVNSLLGEQPQKSCFKEEVPYQIEFSEILDRENLQEFTNVTTTHDVMARGWDGVVDALIYPNTTSLEKILPYVSMTVKAGQVHLYHDLAIHKTANTLKCDPAAIQALAKQIEKWRVVMMFWIIVGNSEVVPLLGEDIPEPEQPGCWKDLYHANRRLRANAWMQGIARQYIHRHVGFEPYLAIHVRPQPDACWQAWMRKDFDQDFLTRKCWRGHDQLHTLMGPKTQAAMQLHGLRNLVVLTHPHMHNVVNDLLAKVNLTAKYILPEYVYDIAGCHDTSSTFLMLVEMQVAVQSSVFLGTASSSITETVLYERLAMGNKATSYLDRPFPPALSSPSPSPAASAAP